MMMTSPALVRRVLAPDGSVLTLADLPPPDAQRWVASRKAIIVAAVRGGLLSMSDACARYRLTTEEFLNWQTQVDRNGLHAHHPHSRVPRDRSAHGLMGRAWGKPSLRRWRALSKIEILSDVIGRAPPGRKC